MERREKEPKLIILHNFVSNHDIIVIKGNHTIIVLAKFRSVTKNKTFST